MLTNKHYQVHRRPAGDGGEFVYLELRADSPIGEVVQFADLYLLRRFMGDTPRFWEFVVFACRSCDAEAELMVKGEMRFRRLKGC